MRAFQQIMLPHSVGGKYDEGRSPSAGTSCASTSEATSFDRFDVPPTMRRGSDNPGLMRWVSAARIGPNPRIAMHKA